MASTSIRPTSTFSLPAELAAGFNLKGITRDYSHQYANIYFARLVVLREAVKAKAAEKWADVSGKPKHVDRVLDVNQGQLCWILGTVYMDMPLKPNVLEDISKDQWITAPPPRAKFFSDEDETLLEDESGRVRLVGDRIKSAHLVTGVVVAVLGYEGAAGDFVVVDLCFAGIPPHIEASTAGASSKGKGKEDDMDVDGEDGSGEKGSWIALLSGLDISGAEEQTYDVRLTLLVEWLMGESASEDDQRMGGSVSRLILAGNSLTTQVRAADPAKEKTYGYDASSYSTAPITALDALLSSLTPYLPIQLLPGASDPTGITLPQQALPRKMFARASKAGNAFECVTNPCWMEVGGKSFLGGAGQTLDDMSKYVEGEDEERLEMAKDTLEWRHMAPTAPDTLWCHPFDDRDPFILEQAPDVYFLGNQPNFASTLAHNTQGEPTRVILIPRFSESGTLVLVHSHTLDVRIVQFGGPTLEDDGVEI